MHYLSVHLLRDVLIINIKEENNIKLGILFKNTRGRHLFAICQVLIMYNA
jgi:hypothetical protein